jgi:putative addiction module component (TIGR02574 family)
VTIAAAKKLILKLPPRQRIKFAETIFDSVPVLRGSVGLAELERRIDEVESGKVKPLDGETVLRDLRKLIKLRIQSRRRHLGSRPGPATSSTNGGSPLRTK